MEFQTTAEPGLNKGKFNVYFAGNGNFVGAWTEVKIPTMKAKVLKVQPAGQSTETKYPTGLAEVDDIELTRYLPTDGQVDKSVRDWFAERFNPKGRTAKAPADVKRDITIILADTDGTEIHEYLCRGCFVVETGGIELKGGEAEPVTATTKISVDFVEQIR